MKKLLIILFILTSCSVTNKKHASKPQLFFACNTWTDHNKNGIYDYPEFENIKSTFHSSEHILFVGYFDFSPMGTKLSFSLIAPDGTLVHEFSKVQLFRKTLLHSEFEVKDLISIKSEGVWEVLWMVEDDVVAVTIINLIY